MSRAVARQTYYYIGRRITLQDQRHIVITISKKHAYLQGAAKADFKDTSNSNNKEQYEIPDNLAASYTGQTAANYSVIINVLKRLTADFLKIFRQVSYQQHKFLKPVKQPLLQPALKRKGIVDIRELIPLKRPKVLHLKKPSLEASKDQLILQALQTVLRDDYAQFRTAQQEEAIQLVAVKETLLIVILLTSRGKSLIFIVPAMLSRSRVTIIIVLYTELKRQLVTRCTNAGLDYQHQPKARDSWPQVVLVLAEAALSNDFLQQAADLCIQGELDRVVIDECYLTFTTTNKYQRKLRGLVLLRNLGCLFVFLTRTLLLLC